MLIATIRTDKPEAEIGLYDDFHELSYLKWHAHFELAEKLHKQVSDLLSEIGKDWHELSGLAVFKGPGSFTGLRIGITFANTLAYSLDIPIVGGSGSDWLSSSIDLLTKNKNDGFIIPEYGADVHISTPRK